MPRYMKNTTTTTAPRYVKKPKVSKAIKTFVKKAVLKKGQNLANDVEVLESLVSTASVFFQDEHMNTTGWIGIPAGLDRFMSFGVQFKYVLHNNSTSIPIICRCLVLINKRGQSDFGSYRSGSQLFEKKVGSSETNQSITGNLYDIVRRVENENYTVLRDFNINLGTATGDGKNTAHGKIWIPYKKMITYTDLGNRFPVKDNVVLLFLPRESPNDQAIPSQIEITSHATWFFKEA